MTSRMIPKARIRQSPQKSENLVRVYQTCLFLLLGATFRLQPSQRLSFGKRHSRCQALWGGQDAPLMLPCCCALMMPSRAATWPDAPILPALPENSRLLGFLLCQILTKLCLFILARSGPSWCLDFLGRGQSLINDGGLKEIKANVGIF